MNESIERRIERLQTSGIIDMHFDLQMDLYEKRGRRDVLETEFLPEFQAGNISVLGAAIYIEDRYLPQNGLRVALDLAFNGFVHLVAALHEHRIL